MTRNDTPPGGRYREIQASADLRMPLFAFVALVTVGVVGPALAQDVPSAVSAVITDATPAAPVNFSLLGRVLPADGPLYLYGPYRRAGRHTAPSNDAFDRDLRQRNPAWGVRDLEAVTELAAAHGFEAPEVIDMPANNLSLVFRRS